MYNEPEALEVLDGIYPAADLLLASIKLRPTDDTE